MEEVPYIVSKMRELNMGLSILIFEDNLNPEDLHWFTQDELYSIKLRTTRKSLLDEIKKMNT